MVSEALTQNIATIGENQSLRRAAILSVGSGVVTGYVHNAAAPGLGKIGVLVALVSSDGAAVLEPLGKPLPMHVAAPHPHAPNAADLSPVLRARHPAQPAEKDATRARAPHMRHTTATQAN